MAAMEIGNILFFSYHSNGCYEEKRPHKNLNLKDLTMTEKIRLIGSVQGEIPSQHLPAQI